MGWDDVARDVTERSYQVAEKQQEMAKERHDWEGELKTRLANLANAGEIQKANVLAKSHVDAANIQYGPGGASDRTNKAHTDAAAMAYGYAQPTPGSYLDSLTKNLIDVNTARSAFEKDRYEGMLQEALKKKQKGANYMPGVGGSATGVASPSLVSAESGDWMSGKGAQAFSDVVDKWTPDWFQKGRNSLIANMIQNPGMYGATHPGLGAVAGYLRLKSDAELKPNSMSGTAGKYVDEAVTAYLAARGMKGMGGKGPMPYKSNPYDYKLRKIQGPGTAVMPYGGV